jgi:glycosyltransferase involved in cell wall biosynthesis
VNILVLTPEYLPANGGGIITFYRHLLPEFAAAGHHIRVIEGSGLRSESSPCKRSIDGVEIETLEHRRLVRHLSRFRHLKSLPGLARHLAAAWAMWEQSGEANDVDIIEACDWGLQFVPAVICGKQPTVVQTHGSIGQIALHDPIIGEAAENILVRLIETLGLQRATEVHASTHANAEFWKTQLERKIRTVRPAWRSTQAPVVADRSNEAGLVIGRVQHWKGPHVLCQALALLGDRAPEITWIGRDTVSGEVGRSHSHALAKEFPRIWGRKIRHLDQISPDEVRMFQSAARFVVVPSTWDVFNFTCVEAMAAGRPVICSSGAGASELIEDGVNGFVFEADNPVALAAAIERVLMLDPASASAIKEAAQKSIGITLDPSRVAAERLRIYTKLIGNFKPRKVTGNDWFCDACSGKNTQTDELAFLDHQPLSELIPYLGYRLAKKLRRVNSA